MISDRWSHAKRLLNALLEAEPNNPGAWLDERCDDPALRAEVKSLFSAHEGEFLEGGSPHEWLGDSRGEPDGRGLATPVGRPEAGIQIGAYRLLEEIGLGGMSVVYRAERADEAFEQTVAVKLLQRRLLADNAEQRFRAERQVLASLDHPNIARLIDGGVTDGGRPYLVMEHVDGVPITQYADRNALGLDARLDLLGQVMEAVQAAHRQLVVHRDLKPANVLVTEAEDGPRVKLLDFGIAKLLDDALPVTRPETRTGHHLMTPSYAAPEQVTGDEVTTVTDVYQLGVLVYELLVGTPPFDVKDKSPTEIERILTEVEPPRPSEKARGEAVPPEVLQGDLDQILHNALRKEPERRYPSVEALAADFQRYLDGRPVEARPITQAYRLRKFVQRHRAGVAATAAFVVLVAGFIVTLVWQQAQTARQRDRAQTEAEKSQHVSEFLVGLFEASNPMGETGDSVTARELLQRGQQRVSQLRGQPAVQAQMLDAIGQAHMGLGNYEIADSLLRRALTMRQREHDAPSPELAASLDHLSRARDGLGEYAAAESLAYEALNMRRAVREDMHPDIAESMDHLALYKKRQGEYALAESLYHEALSMRRQINEAPHRDIAGTMSNLGQLYTERGNYAAAGSLHREALAMRRELFGQEHPKTSESLNNLAQTVERQGDLTEAESLYRKTLAIDREVLGPEHPVIAIDMNNLAVVVERQGRLVEAESLKRRSLTMRRKLLGEDHPDVTASMNNLAVLLRKKGAYEEAASLFNKVLGRLQDQFGNEHPYVAFTTGNLGDTRLEQGQLAAADSLYQAARSMLIDVFGEQHPDVAAILEDLADLREEQGRYVAAARLHQEALAIRRNALGEAHPQTAESLGDWADVLMKQNKIEAADSLYREALAINEKALPTGDWRTAWMRSKLGACLVEKGRYAAAEPHLKKGLDVLREQRGTSDEYTQEAVRRLVDLYDAWGKPAKAAAHRDTLAAMK